MDEKFFQGLDKALQHTMDKAPPQFGGKPGEAVPEVDPNDIKAVSQFYQEMAKDHPCEQFAIGIELLGQVCKPGADVTAVYYRASMIEMIAKLIATEQL